MSDTRKELEAWKKELGDHAEFVLHVADLIDCLDGTIPTIADRAYKLLPEGENTENITAEAYMTKALAHASRLALFHACVLMEHILEKKSIPTEGDEFKKAVKYLVKPMNKGESSL